LEIKLRGSKISNKDTIKRRKKISGG